MTCATINTTSLYAAINELESIADELRVIERDSKINLVWYENSMIPNKLIIPFYSNLSYKPSIGISLSGPSFSVAPVVTIKYVDSDSSTPARLSELFNRVIAAGSTLQNLGPCNAPAGTNLDAGVVNAYRTQLGAAAGDLNWYVSSPLWGRLMTYGALIEEDEGFGDRFIFALPESYESLLLEFKNKMRGIYRILGAAESILRYQSNPEPGDDPDEGGDDEKCDELIEAIRNLKVDVSVIINPILEAINNLDVEAPEIDLQPVIDRVISEHTTTRNLIEAIDCDCPPPDLSPLISLVLEQHQNTRNHITAGLDLTNNFVLEQHQSTRNHITAGLDLTNNFVLEQHENTRNEFTALIEGIDVTCPEVDLTPVIVHVTGQHQQTQGLVINQHTETRAWMAIQAGEVKNHVTTEHQNTQEHVTLEHEETRGYINGQHQGTRQWVDIKANEVKAWVNAQHTATQIHISGEHQGTRSHVTTKTTEVKTHIDTKFPALSGTHEFEGCELETEDPVWQNLLRSISQAVGGELAGQILGKYIPGEIDDQILGAIAAELVGYVYDQFLGVFNGFFEERSRAESWNWQGEGLMGLSNQLKAAQEQLNAIQEALCFDPCEAIESVEPPCTAMLVLPPDGDERFDLVSQLEIVFIEAGTVFDRNSSTWRISIPNPRMDLNWCEDIAPLIWDRGPDVYGRLRWQKGGLSWTGGYFGAQGGSDPDLAEEIAKSFLTRLAALSLEVPRPIRISKGISPKRIPHRLTIEPIRATILIIDNEGNKRRVICLRPPPGGC